MKLLILGGTHFLGRHVAETALGRGHEVTLFHRGQTNNLLFPEAEHIYGDRDGGLDKLRQRTWDAVIDTCGYVPRIVRQSAELLQEKVGKYLFISSISAYKHFRVVGLDEHHATAELEDENTEQVTGETYGALKAACEREVMRLYPEQSVIIRPGLIVGPHDPTDRFTYWPHRISQGGHVLVPGTGDQQIQYIDARDLAEWIVTLADSDKKGVYNATGPEYKLTIGDLVETCRQVCNPEAEFEWVDEAFLLERGVGPFVELPLWLPASDPEHAGFLRVSNDKALEDGLAFRPLAETIADTIHWDRTRNTSEMKAGMNHDKETELLKAWEERKREPGHQ